MTYRQPIQQDLLAPETVPETLIPPAELDEVRSLLSQLLIERLRVPADVDQVREDNDDE